MLDIACMNLTPVRVNSLVLPLEFVIAAGQWI